jgi:hypothetical protein
VAVKPLNTYVGSAVVTNVPALLFHVYCIGVVVPLVSVAVKVDEPPLHTVGGVAVKELNTGKGFTVIVAGDDVSTQPLALTTITE